MDLDISLFGAAPLHAARRAYEIVMISGGVALGVVLGMLIVRFVGRRPRPRV